MSRHEERCSPPAPREEHAPGGGSTASKRKIELNHPEPWLPGNQESVWGWVVVVTGLQALTGVEVMFMFCLATLMSSFLFFLYLSLSLFSNKSAPAKVPSPRLESVYSLEPLNQMFSLVSC